MSSTARAVAWHLILSRDARLQSNPVRSDSAPSASICACLVDVRDDSPRDVLDVSVPVLAVLSPALLLVAAFAVDE
jgi:hypothetical protein